MKNVQVSFRNVSSEISHTTCAGFGQPIVFHLTPLGKRNYRLRKMRWDAEQRRIARDNRREERESRRQLARDEIDIRRMERQKARLIRSLKKNEIPAGRKDKCAACAKTVHCVPYYGTWFCLNCLKLGKNEEIEVVCPRHKTWCGGKYGSCGGCLGEDFGII